MQCIKFNYFFVRIAPRILFSELSKLAKKRETYLTGVKYMTFLINFLKIELFTGVRTEFPSLSSKDLGMLLPLDKR